MSATSSSTARGGPDETAQAGSDAAAAGGAEDGAEVGAGPDDGGPASPLKARAGGPNCSLQRWCDARGGVDLSFKVKAAS